jgi:hypothetical protein
MPETPKIASLKYFLYSNLGRYRRLTEQRATVPELRCCYRSHRRPNSQTIKPFLKQGPRAIPIDLERSTDKALERTGDRGMPNINRPLDPA